MLQKVKEKFPEMKEENQKYILNKFLENQMMDENSPFQPIDEAVS